MSGADPYPSQARDGAGRGRPARPSPHDRLLDAVTDLAIRDGYPHLTVEAILAHASVSRGTFYQYFASGDECFWSAYRQHADTFVTALRAAVGRQPSRHLAALDALIATALGRTGIARLLGSESLAAGQTGRAEREALIARIEQAMTASGSLQHQIDLPAKILIGATFRRLSMRLTGTGRADGLREDMLAWAAAFTHSSRSWSAALVPRLPAARTGPPARASGSRPTGTPHERILRATAGAIREKGYHAVTVADIVATAGVSRRRFYNEFAGKAAASIGAYEYGFGQALAVCTPAFFTAGSWPERVWNSTLAFARHFAREPLFAYLGFVECYAVGRGFTARVYDTQLAFTLFLEEGYRQHPDGHGLSRATSELTAAAVAEAALQASSSVPGLFLGRTQPLVVYIALAPFIGTHAAGSFVAGQLATPDRDSEGAVSDPAQR